jgi:hypothetical protein
MLVLLNAALALFIQGVAPLQPAYSDRQAYEYVGQHPFEPDCGWSIYCYRVIVPALLEQIPADSETRWRWYQVAATAVAGLITSLTTLQMTGTAGVGAIAAILAQTTYGFSFTAYDPYTADPLVFVFAATIAWCWMGDRWRLALAAGLIGVFVKETVALVSGACLLAALMTGPTQRRPWIVSGAIVAGTLLVFRWVMDTYFGWGVSANPAAQFTSGSWLVIWWQNNPFLVRKLYLLFAPFGVAWLFAMLALRDAPQPLRHLALGSILPILALCYVQTPERALSNAFYVVVPLAAWYLSRVRFSLALSTAVANGLVTAKIGSSSEWLPPSGMMLVPAVALTAWILWIRRR